MPFTRLGRCNLLGLQSNDHGTIHRDGEDEAEVGHFITLCPRADKRLFLWDEDRQKSVPIGGRAYCGYTPAAWKAPALTIES